MDEELQRRIEAENMKAARKSVAERVFASDEPVEAMHHLFNGIEDTIEEYNEQYVTEERRALSLGWLSTMAFQVSQGEDRRIEVRLDGNRRSLTETQYPTQNRKTIPMSAHLDGHVFFDDTSGEAKPISKVAGEIVADLLFPEG